MGKPNPTKRIPSTRLDQVVMLRDESDELELLAFENNKAAGLFEACLGASGYGSARGGYELESFDMAVVRQTQGYQDWLKAGQRALTLAYVRYVSERMDAGLDDEDVSGDLLNMGVMSDAYAPMTGRDFALLYDEEYEEDEDEGIMREEDCA